MRRSHLWLLSGYLSAFSFMLLAGCGGTDSAKPAAEMSEINQYLADNPDQNADEDTEDADMEENLTTK